MMLVHVGQGEVAARVHNAWLKTLEDGQHTGDIWNENHSKARLGTREFGCAVEERLGQKPQHFAAVSYPEMAEAAPAEVPIPRWDPPAQKQIVGVDLFLQHRGNPQELGDNLLKLGDGNLNLVMVTKSGRQSLAQSARLHVLHRSLALPLHGAARAHRDDVANSGALRALERGRFRRD
jgi:isocitrate dehydrogenase